MHYEVLITLLSLDDHSAARVTRTGLQQASARVRTKANFVWTEDASWRPCWLKALHDNTARQHRWS